MEPPTRPGRWASWVLADIQARIEERRWAYTDHRAHSALGNLAPRPTQASYADSNLSAVNPFLLT